MKFHAESLHTMKVCAFLCDGHCFKVIFSFLGSGAWTRHRQTRQRHIASKRRVTYRRLQYVIRAPVSSQAHLVRCVCQALAVDMTARNLQEKVKKQGLPWSTVKGFDTFTPIGCVLITCLGHPSTDHAFLWQGIHSQECDFGPPRPKTTTQGAKIYVLLYFPLGFMKLFHFSRSMVS